MSNSFSTLREEARQDREEGRARFAILERKIAAVSSAQAASSARSMSLPLPSRSGSTKHFQQIRAGNGNGKQPLQAAGGAPYDSDHNDSDEDEDLYRNPVDQPDSYIRVPYSAISVPNTTLPAASGAGNGGGGDDSSDNSYGNDDSHGSEGTDENIPSPIAPPPFIVRRPSSEIFRSSESGSPDSPSDPKRSYADVAHPDSVGSTLIVNTQLAKSIQVLLS